MDKSVTKYLRPEALPETETREMPNLPSAVVGNESALVVHSTDWNGNGGDDLAPTAFDWDALPELAGEQPLVISCNIPPAEVWITPINWDGKSDFPEDSDIAGPVHYVLTDTNPVTISLTEELAEALAEQGKPEQGKAEQGKIKYATVKAQWSGLGLYETISWAIRIGS